MKSSSTTSTRIGPSAIRPRAPSRRRARPAGPHRRACATRRRSRRAAAQAIRVSASPKPWPFTSSPSLVVKPSSKTRLARSLLPRCPPPLSRTSTSIRSPSSTDVEQRPGHRGRRRSKALSRRLPTTVTRSADSSGACWRQLRAFGQREVDAELVGPARLGDHDRRDGRVLEAARHLGRAGVSRLSDHRLDERAAARRSARARPCRRWRADGCGTRAPAPAACRCRPGPRPARAGGRATRCGHASR